MTSFALHVRRQGRRWIALLLLSLLYPLARLPGSPDGLLALSQQFQFARSALPIVSGPEVRSVRPVHPSLRHIESWISAVGAAVALHDLDRDGLPNDVCYVDTRTDQVIVAPAPQTGQRYGAFALDAGLLFSRATMAPMGCLPGDMNEDGTADLLIYYWGRTPIAFLRHGRAMAAASFQPLEIVPGGERWYSSTAVFADVDGDGRSDLIVGNYFADGARILDATAPNTESMQHSMSRAFNAGADRVLLRGTTAAVSYRIVPDAFPEGVGRGWTLAIGAADLDGDLLPELYLANDFGPDRLLHAVSTPGHPKFELVEGRRTFTTPRSRVLGRDSFKGMGVDFGDLNGDQIPDMFVSNIAAPFALEESHFLWMSDGRTGSLRRRVAPYTDRGEEAGVSRSSWGWDTRIADMNNDGVPELLQAVGFMRGTINRWPELHEIAMANDQLLSTPRTWHSMRPGDDLNGHDHNPFYVRGADGRYHDVATEIGLGAPHLTRGIAVADVDGDGRLDYAIGNQWEDSVMLRNVSPDAGAFLGLRVTRGPGVPAIGATATIRLPDGRSITAQSDGGSGHSGKRSPEIHVGLGRIAPDRELEVKIRWRDAAGVHERTYRLLPGWHDIRLGRDA